MKSVKRLLCALLGLSMAVGVCVVPTTAASPQLYSDTTYDMQRAVGEKYCFYVRTNSGEPLAYTVGNGKVLQTKQEFSTFGKQVETLGGAESQEFWFSFTCVGEGETGVYVTQSGNTTCLFKVKVSNQTISMKQAVGTNASKYQKLRVQYMDNYKTVTDRQEIAKLLKEIAPIRLEKKPDSTPPTGGWTYAIDFYPTSGSGSYHFIDGGGSFSKKDGCTLDAPVGRYWIADRTSYVTWHKTMDDFYKNAPGAISKVQ